MVLVGVSAAPCFGSKAVAAAAGYEFKGRSVRLAVTLGKDEPGPIKAPSRNGHTAIITDRSAEHDF